MSGSSAHKIKNVCVFGGSSPEKEFLESANHLGRVLAERRIHLVYGRGSLRLMKSMSTSAFLEGSQVLDIIPKALAKDNITTKTVGEKLKVSIMSERIASMLEYSDAFIALPSGLGTFEEIFQISS